MKYFITKDYDLHIYTMLENIKSIEFLAANFTEFKPEYQPRNHKTTSLLIFQASH